MLTGIDFAKVDWDAIGQTIPTMFALSFFGIIHVPINVPALGIAVQQDDININRELFGHGISNALSGFLGSIQNYLVFANSRLFIQNGGNSRWAGVLLALATTGIWIAGPAMIGYIPIMIVGDSDIYARLGNGARGSLGHVWKDSPPRVLDGFGHYTSYGLL